MEKLQKSQPPKKNKAYVLMASEEGMPMTRAVPVSEFIKDYLLTEEIANYILDKYNLISSGEKEVRFTAIGMFINKQFRSFFDISFNSVNLPMLWCRGKRYTKDSITPFILVLSPYYDAVVAHNEKTNTYINPQTMIFEGRAWYSNVFEFLNVGPIAKARIPLVIIEENETWSDIAKRLYSLAEVKYE